MGGDLDTKKSFLYIFCFFNFLLFLYTKMGLQQPQEKERETGSPDHISILSAPGIKLKFMSPFICDINILTPRPLFLSFSPSENGNHISVCGLENE